MTDLVTEVPDPDDALSDTLETVENYVLWWYNAVT